MANYFRLFCSQVILKHFKKTQRKYLYKNISIYIQYTLVILKAYISKTKGTCKLRFASAFEAHQRRPSRCRATVQLVRSSVLKCA